jgi:hypothetical protein
VLLGTLLELGLGTDVGLPVAEGGRPVDEVEVDPGGGGVALPAADGLVAPVGVAELLGPVGPAPVAWPGPALVVEDGLGVGPD